MQKENNVLAKLNEEFDKSTTNYHRINCEKRTNLNLYLGHHFVKASDELNRRLEKQGVDKSTRIRVTKNHIFKICEYIVNSMLDAGGDFDVFPANQDELQDQKAAELHRAVLPDWKHKNGIGKILTELAYDFETPWSIPMEVYDAMASQYPTLNFSVRFLEEQGWGGEMESSNGEMCVVKEWDIPVTHEERMEYVGYCHCEENDELDYMYDDCPKKLEAVNA